MSRISSAVTAGTDLPVDVRNEFRDIYQTWWSSDKYLAGGIRIPTAERDTGLEWGHTTTTEGTGFELAIVAGIVGAHGWEIDVCDAATGGTRFEITGL
jgi:signal transduction histidine kinase